MKKGMSDFQVLLTILIVVVFMLIVYFVIKRGLDNVLR